jgi:hypothetical protein
VEHEVAGPLLPEEPLMEHELGPDDFACKYCGRPVRYANDAAGRGGAFDATQVLGGGYQLADEEMQDGTPTGRWVAQYTRAADRDYNQFGFRRHDCKARKLYNQR